MREVIKNKIIKELSENLKVKTDDIELFGSELNGKFRVKKGEWYGWAINENQMLKIAKRNFLKAFGSGQIKLDIFYLIECLDKKRTKKWLYEVLYNEYSDAAEVFALLSSEKGNRNFLEDEIIERKILSLKEVRKRKCDDLIEIYADKLAKRKSRNIKEGIEELISIFGKESAETFIINEGLLDENKIWNKIIEWNYWKDFLDYRFFVDEIHTTSSGICYWKIDFGF